MAENTPMMSQYQALKKQHPNDVLFFRLGDFYEMFDEDAREISRLLNLTLTHRAGRPMCGIPYHAAKIYIARLLRLGKKIAVCEQINLSQNPRALAERKVVEIITPGTAVEEEYLDQTSNNYLAALSCSKGKAGFAYIDVSTAAFYATSWNLSDMEEEFAKELGRCSPRELLLPQSLQQQPMIQNVLARSAGTMTVSYYPDWHFSSDQSFKRLTAQFRTANLRSFSLLEDSPETAPAGFLLDYLDKTSNSALPHITGISVYRDSDFVIIDDSSRRNLEITANLRDGTVQYSLLETINYGVTAMGKRQIKNWLLSPLRDRGKIITRQNRVRDFVNRRDLLKKVRSGLSSILDVERLAGRIAMDRAHAKDLQALRASLESWIGIRQNITGIEFWGTDLGTAGQIVSLIQSAILDDPATTLTEGHLIKDGWSADLDHYRRVQNDFNSILEQYIAEERERTGISNLKVRYNRISGYYIEVSRGKISSVPEHFILKRSLVNGDRYTTVRLRELEQELNSSGVRIIEEEKKLFLEVRDNIKQYISYLYQIAADIADFDAVSSFAQAAVEHGWVQPEVDDSDVLEIVNGRHPVVELHLPTGEFVPNNASFDDTKYFALITGPNMAGKSTYLRQNALIVLLAQTGSFVPAEKARIGIVDRIFCRVGASDNLARGESTFLVEMTETAHILRSATSQSLVIMDEVGRGTSTEDGLSIAWAVSEYLLNQVRCKTLFATHYHELTRLEHPALMQLCLEVLEQEGQVIFLKRIKSGAATNSYGIHVAQLAGIPRQVIDRARELLSAIQTVAGAGGISAALSDSTLSPVDCPAPEQSAVSMPGLFSDEELVLDEILSVNPDELSPLEALLCVSRWKKTLSGR